MTRAGSGPPEPVAGLLVVDKPRGPTSHDVVARVRRLAGTRKVGHAGTLDPMATGVLVLGVGRATRLLGHLVLTDKRYTATVRLGARTTTDDAEGEVLETADPVELAAVDEKRVRAAFAAQVGDLAQVPSSVSAVKVEGRRAHDRVRAGERVDLPPRPVRVHELVVGGVLAVEAGLDVEVDVHCSSGTYVRAIARDVGVALGVGGHLAALRRTSVGPFGLADASPLAQLEEPGRDFEVLAMAEAARVGFATHELDAEQARAVRHGRPLDLALAGLTALFGPDGELLALYEPREGRARPRAVLV